MLLKKLYSNVEKWDPKSPWVGKKTWSKKAQSEVNFPVHAMAADNNTRWNSKVKLMCFILDRETALRLLLYDRNTSDLIPSADIFEVISKLIICWVFTCSSGYASQHWFLCVTRLLWIVLHNDQVVFISSTWVL